MSKKFKQLLYLKEAELIGLTKPKRSVQIIEKAFAEYDQGNASMPAKVYLELPSGDFRAMPAYSKSARMAGLKWVNVHPGNKRRGLPSVMAMMFLNSPDTGQPLCIMNAGLLTAIRTGAAGGVAVKHIAPAKANSLLLIGAGVQSLYQALAINSVRQIKHIIIHDLNPKASLLWLEQNKKYFKAKVTIAQSLKEACQQSDIIVTTTPSRNGFIKLKWLKPNCHINAIGADASGKQELKSEIILHKNTLLFADDPKQTLHSGEINKLVTKGQFKTNDIYATLGAVINKRKKLKKKKGNITVFDSTGLAVQDIALASIMYKKAIRKGIGTWLRF